MKLGIDDARCQGHAICYLLAPDLFDVDDDGRGRVRDPDVGNGLGEQARIAEGRCPERAVVLEAG